MLSRVNADEGAPTLCSTLSEAHLTVGLALPAPSLIIANLVEDLARLLTHSSNRACYVDCFTLVAYLPAVALGGNESIITSLGPF